VGYQIVDALDTFLVMGLEAEYARAAGWVRDHLDWDKDAEFSTFEVSHAGLRRAARLLIPRPRSDSSAVCCRHTT
jgi:hypothetical protein